MGLNPSKPGITIFSVPVLTPGVGLEVAAAIKAESVDVTQSMIVNFADAWATEQHVKLVAGAITPL